MENDELIMQEILKAAYELKGWHTPGRIAMKSRMHQRIIEPYLQILCDRRLMTSKTEKRSYDSPYTKPGQKKPEKRTYDHVEYRINENGNRYVESGFREESKADYMRGINITGSPNTLVMCNSPGSVQINQINPEVTELLKELRETILRTMEDESKQIQYLEMVDFIEEEYQKEKPKTSMLKGVFEKLNSYAPLAGVTIELARILGLG